MGVQANLVEFLRDEDMTEFLPALIRLVADGEPVPLPRLAAAADVAEEWLAAWLRGQPGTDWDEQDRLLGFGLTQRETRHRFVVDGRELFTFCAADTLVFPPILGRSASVTSRCPSSPPTPRPSSGVSATGSGTCCRSRTSSTKGSRRPVTSGGAAALDPAPRHRD